MQTGPGDRPVRKIKPVKVKPRVVKAPAGDVASSGGDYGMKQANRAAKSPVVKRAQQAVYSAQPVPQRKQILANATGSVKANVQPVHARAIARNRQLAQSAAAKDTKGNTDRARAQAFLAAHPEILKPKKSEGDGSLIGTITGAADIGLKLASKIPHLLSNAQFAHLATGGRTGSSGADAADYVAKTAGNAPKDTAEIVTTTPTSLVKLGDTAIHDPKKVPGMLAAPYKELAKNPGKFFSEHPVSTALMLDPAVRVPGRVVGKGARLAGKQTLERAPATLPGTALKQTRVASKDAFVNAAQKRRDAKKPAPTMTDKQVQRRVDEFHDFARQQAARIEAQTHKKIKKRYAHLPKADRNAIIADRMERARVAARGKTDKMFAQEFGATERLSTGAAQREAAKAVRQTATTTAKTARKTVEVAKAQHDAAMIDARLALSKSKRSPQLDALEKQHRRSLAEVTRAKQAFQQARVEVGVAKGRSQVLVRNIGGGMAGGRGVELANETLAKAAERVKAAREVARGTDQAVSAQRARMAGVPPAEHQALMKAMAGETQARTDLAAARTVREQARTAHIATKRAMTDSTLVDPAKAGRVFDHKADARYVADRVPFDATLRDVGNGKYAVVPKVASQRLMKQQVVGSSKATGAKVLRRSRAALTQAVLPTSMRWLAGQGGEAGLRSVVAGAGPMDLLRINKAVKQMNKDRAGAGDEMLMRITGGQFGLTGTAREFAQGTKSLADEFADTSLQRPARMATRAGQVLPAKAARVGWGLYTRAMFDGVNGLIENTARKAMAGQALKDSPLMERSIIGLSDKAIADAAKGLRGTENQVALGRAVDRMYGKYQKFGPGQREALLHWTPFLPWYINAVTFLTKVLPVDHPIHAALVADANAATQDWRKSHKLSWYGDHRPPWMMAMGGYPTKDGGVVPLGGLTPFGIGADPGQAAADLMLPQVLGPIKNLAGVDFKWQRLKYPGYKGREFNPAENALRAGSTILESQVPLVREAGKLTGFTARHVDHKANVPTTGEALGKIVNPLTPVKSSPPKKKAHRPKVRKQSLGGSGGKLPLGGSGHKLPLG